MERTILHCDCNGFFASVECVLNPEYKDVPMAVCGSSENRHGIILAKNELAKKFNIKTAETIWSAKRKCPDLVLAPPHKDIYAEHSKKINKVYADFTDMVEPFGIDESWLDVTASYKLFGDGKTIADELRRRIRETFGLTISVGVSFNKVFAKLGSDYKKPDATTVISRENFKDIVFPLPVADLLYVGSKASSKLGAIGIKTIGDLAGPCAFAICMGSSRALYGKFSDKLPLKKAMLESAVLCVACYLVAVLSQNPVLGLIGCAICGFSVGIFWPGTFTIATSLAAISLPGAGTAMYAFMALAGDIGCSSGPSVVGFVADAVDGNLKPGLAAAMIFPIVIFVGISLLKSKKAD